MDRLSIPHDALVMVGDGQKALFLRNVGDERNPDLRTERAFGESNPPTREQGTDRPGRSFKSAGTTRRSSVDTTDWHELEKQHFADHVASVLEQRVRADNIKAIVIVAPPRTLAELRHVMHADVRHRVIAEINKDLTKQPVWEIEKHLAG